MDISIAQFLVAFIAYIGGYAMGPFLAKRSLGALQQLTGTVNDRSKGILDRGRNAIGERGKKRKEFKKGVKSERRAERAAGNTRTSRFTGERAGALARARMRADAGLPVTGGVPGSSAHQRARQSMEAANNEIFEKQAKEADLEMRKDPATYNDADHLLSVVKDASASRGKRQAAINRLVQFGDDEKLRELNALQASGGLDGVGSNVLEDAKLSKEFFSSFKDKAPDLAKGGVGRLHGTAASERTGWTEASWKLAESTEASKGATGNTRRAAEALAADSKTWNSLAPEIQSHLETAYGVTPPEGAPGYSPPAPTVSTPPTAKATSTDGNWYTTDDPANPAAEWKPTNKS